MESTHEAPVALAETQATRIPLIGEPAPAFEAVTTQGPIRFPDDYKGKWVILFSHPADFTPVCTTEFMTFATLMPQFEALNCKLIGLSIDSNFSHIAWLRTIKEKIKYKGMENVEVKPYVRHFDCREDAISGWVEKHFEEGAPPPSVVVEQF